MPGISASRAAVAAVTVANVGANLAVLTAVVATVHLQAKWLQLDLILLLLLRLILLLMLAARPAVATAAAGA